jgi:hypothetical protein
VKVTIPGQNEAISLGGSPVSPIWYTAFKYIEKLQPLSDIDNSSLQSQITANTNAIATKSDITRAINFQTGTTYTLALTDAGDVVDCSNASAVTVTVPPNSSVAFAVGTQIEVMQGGAGKVTLAQGAGVTINSAAGNKSIAARYVGVTLLKVATDTWRLMGSLIV